VTPRIGVLVAARPEAEAILAGPAFGWEPCAEPPPAGSPAAPAADPPAGAARTGFAPDLWRSRNAPITLCLSGAGKVLATWATARLAPGADILLALGTAGSLGGDAIGSLWLCHEFVEHDYDVSAFGIPRGVTLFERMDGPVLSSARPEQLAAARAALARAGLRAGECRMASGDCFIADGGRARELMAWTGARLVDMECAAVAKACVLRARGRDGLPLPFISLRSVSDNADHEAAEPWEERARAASRDFAAFLKAFAGI
jgi:nucleoside phosphorylase